MVLAAVGQLCSTSSLLHNAKQAVSLIRQASAVGANVLFLPEATDYIAATPQQSLQLARDSRSVFLAELSTALKTSSHDLSVFVGVHEPAENERVKNVLLYLDSNGSIVGRYQKLHLFDVDLSGSSGGQKLKESDSVEPGSVLEEPIQTAVGKVGPAICYDIRFPEHALRLRRLGAEVLQFPSAFTLRTGAAHWEILARSRAIDTQCYVVMAAQVGKHDEEGKRQSYGHAMIVDPWGSVIARAPDIDSEPRIITADIDLNHVEAVRANMPLWEQRRRDIFGDF